MLKIDKTGVSTSKRVYFRSFLPSLASVMAARPCFCSFLLFVVEVPANWETGIRTNEIGLMFKTEIGLMEIGLILFSAALELMEIGLIEIGLNNFWHAKFAITLIKLTKSRHVQM